MKKSSFVALVLSVVGVLLLGMGMCMCTLPEWGMFNQGVFVGVIGLVVLLAMVIIYRRMEHKEPIRISGKTVLTVLVGVAGAIGLGIGMCFTMVYSMFTLGIIVGIAGIALLLSLIPLCMGLR